MQPGFRSDCRNTPLARGVRTTLLHRLRHHKTFAILAREHAIRFRISRDAHGGGVEVQRAAQPVRDVGQVHQHARRVPLFDIGVQVRHLAAANGGDKILPVAAAFLALRTGLLLASQERFVRRIAVDRHVAFGAVEYVADGPAGLSLLIPAS